MLNKFSLPIFISAAGLAISAAQSNPPDSALGPAPDFDKLTPEEFKDSIVRTWQVARTNEARVKELEQEIAELKVLLSARMKEYEPSLGRKPQKETAIVEAGAGASPAPPEAVAPPKAAASSIQHRVAEGETIAGISRRYKVSGDQIMAANGIADARFLKSGAVLTIPVVAGEAAAPISAAEKRREAASTPLSHEVGESDTLYRISQRYGVSIAELQRLNGIDDPTKLRAGQVLIIRAGQASAEAPGMEQPSGSQSVKIVRPSDVSESGVDLPGDFDPAGAGLATGEPAVEKTAPAPAPSIHVPHQHVVAEGETLEGIARLYGLDVTRLRELNSMHRSDEVRAGSILHLPVEQYALNDASSRYTFEVGHEPEPVKAVADGVYAAYSVNSGDTAQTVARAFHTTAAELRAMNGLPADADLPVGEVIRVPMSGALQ
ncbi:MAG: LysM peptidoglycan-binding domain-containing protein [Verrucomicrobiales bacterium]